MKKYPIQFFFFVIILSVPFWIIGHFAKDFTQNNPMKLPISALMTFCPAISVFILTFRSVSIFYLIRNVIFDFKKIRGITWWAIIIFLMPTIAMASQFLFPPISRHVSEQFSLFSLIVIFGLYFVGATGEEIGWSAYVTEPIQNKIGALYASIVIGFFWAIWHIIPFIQMGKTTDWITMHCISTILLRVIMIWLFNNTGRSVFGMILFHTMINFSPYLFGRVNFVPEVLFYSLMLISGIIVVLWEKDFVNLRFRKI